MSVVPRSADQLAVDPYAAAANVPPPDLETSKATDPKVDEAAHAARYNRAASATGSITGGRRGGEALALHTEPNAPISVDPTAPADIVRDKATRRRMNSIIDRHVCNVPDAQQRLAAMSPADRAAWERRCAKVAPPVAATPPATR
ncbi:MAG: hypothetical protein KF773_39595 [Deltaproteobacteria bacterium]|nr:hypothetical protein [Deltaproteobacteria bacterium]